MEEMAIARFVFQLLFNCAFEYFEISCIIINPQMIELLFDEATNMPLQIHSQRTEIFHDEADCLNFAWNHLISNHLGIDLCFGDEEIMGVLLFKILAKGGNKFLNVTYEYPDVELYFSIVEYIETSQDISKVVKEIKFETMVKFSIEKAAKNKNKLKIEEDGKTTKFQLFNKHNPKIEFSVTIKVKEENYEEIEEESESILENFDNLGIENDFGINVDAVIRRI
ncbi:unnamed protein product [Meloidogyne enterolobii]|uniref:Uncharacterized protein n=1 Tax=Meloidogyne enterolobii TaxID=390850 RepID=A0ACB0YCC6_MELEN